VQLPSNNINEVIIFATKVIHLQDHNDITVCSSIINIQDDNLRIGKYKCMEKKHYYFKGNMGLWHSN
jgi:hypothetical protein